MVSGFFKDKSVSPSDVPNFLKNAKTTNYTIKAGDDLFSLATRFGIAMRSIVVVNEFRHEHLPKVGKVIKIPSL